MLIHCVRCSSTTVGSRSNLHRISATETGVRVAEARRGWSGWRRRVHVDLESPSVRRGGVGRVDDTGSDQETDGGTDGSGSGGGDDARGKEEGDQVANRKDSDGKRTAICISD